MDNRKTEEKNIGRIVNAKSRHRKWVAVLLVLALVVSAGTLWAFRYNGIAATYQKQVLECQAVPGTVSHIHNADDCYQGGDLVCPLEEIEPHEHSEACYTAVLSCGLSENDGHQHTDVCFIPQLELICSLEESDGDETRPAHRHSEECYEEVKILICGMEEGEGAHYHTDACYEQVLTCGIPALPLHVHGPECFRTEEMNEEEIAAMNAAEAEAGADNAEGTEGAPAADDANTIENTDGTNNPAEGQEDGSTPEDGQEQQGDIAEGQEGESVPEEGQEQQDDTEESGEVSDNTEDNADLPMQTTPFSFASRADDILVTVEAPADAFPAGTEMKVRAIYDEQVLSDAADAVEMDENVDGKVVQVQAVDISFWFDGKEFEPLKPIRVVMTPVETPDFDEQTVVHVDDAGETSVIEQEDVEVPEAAFEVEEFSVYCLVYTKLETTVLASDGNNYKITVTAPDNAPFPANAELVVSEITDAASLEEYVSKTESTLEDKNEKVSSARFFDISIAAGGEEIQPLAPVEVRIELADELAEDVQAVHFGENTDILDAALEAGTEESANTVVFNAESFSVYGVFLTKTFVSADGNAYEVTVTYDADAGIPKNSSLTLVEYAEDSEEYQKAKNEIDELHGKTDAPLDAEEELPITGEETFIDGEGISYEAENRAYFASVAKKDTIVEGFSALGITIVDPDGNEIEPSGEVKVSIVMKSLPDGMNEDDLQKSLEVHHLVETAGTVSADQVAGTSVAGSEVAANADGATIEFSTDSFSTYTISWGNGWNSTNVVLHFVDDLGNPIDGFTYNGQPIDDGSIALTTLIPQNGMFDLSQFKKEGYSLSNTHVGQFEDMNGNTPTIIRNEIERADNNVRYWTFNTGNDTAGTTQNNFGTGTTDLYLVYNSTAMAGQGGGGSSPGDIPDLGAPGNEKKASSNEDGTYKISLSVTGNAQHQQTDPHVNVIVVFDTSSSMVSNYIPDSSSVTRLEAAKDALNELATNLLGNNTPEHPNAVEMALVTFNRNANIESLGGSNWTTSAQTYTSTVGTYRNGRRISSSSSSGAAGPENTGIGTAKGTNWAQGLQKAVDLMDHDTDPTYVLFITDGAPSQYWPSGQATGTYVEGEGCYLGARDEARRLVGDKGAILYSLFAYGSSSDYSKDYLGKLVNYAYNSEAAAASYRFNVADNATFKAKLQEILRTISMNFAYANVEIDDGITELSTVVFERINTASFEYTIKYRDYTTTTESTEVTLELTPNTDGTVTIPSKTYGVLDSTASGGVRTITTQEVTVKGATYTGSPNKSVHWDLEKANVQQGQPTVYMLENGWTYTVSFDVWPSQTSYDLTAALNNGFLTYGEDYHYTDETEGTEKTITFEEYKDQITNTRPYTLKTNTNASVKYQQVTQTIDESGHPSYEYGPVKTIPIPYTSNMDLISQLMNVKKAFAHTINAQDPYTKIRFYLLVDGEYYQSDGTLSRELVPYTIDGGTITPAIHTIGMDLSDDNQWTGSIYIAPGLIVDERSTGGEMQVLETGHKYTLEEVIVEGNVYEYEFTSQTVRPMVVNSQLRFLVKQDKYNVPAQGAVTYEIDGEVYFSAVENAQGLTGTNRKTAELDITKIVNDAANLLTTAEENTETFTYRVTLQIPDKYPNGTPVDPAGIVGYEYVPRTQDNAFILYGYQETDTNKGFPEDVARFSGKTFRGWNTLIYRDLAEWENVNGRIKSVRDENGNVVWKIAAVDGYHTVTYDMTLKQDEVIRFTNLPSGTIYTIQEIYANKYPADNAGGTTSGRAPIADPSNIAEEGYEITQVQHTGGTWTSTEVTGDTITGTIEDLDTRYYNQFTNTTRSHHGVRAELKVKKVVEGYEWLNEYYRFTLAAGSCAYSDTEGGTGMSPTPGGTENSVVSIYDTTAEHTLSFGTIRYTRPGTYTYTITEAWAESYVQKPGPATVTVTVEENSDGSLSVTNITGTGPNTVTTFTPATDETLATGLTTMTNTILPTTVHATKVWKQGDVTYTPPEDFEGTVVFTLIKQVGDAEPVETDYTVTLDGKVDTTVPAIGGYESAAWVATFINLPSCEVVTVTDAETGERSRVATTVTYTIKETTGYEGWQQVTTEAVPDGGEIINRQLAVPVALKKVGDASAAADGTPLSEVKFKLYSDEALTKQVTKDAKGNTIGDSNGVIITGEGTEEHPETEGRADIGYLPVGMYYLVEIEGKDGYNMLTSPVQILVDLDANNNLTVKSKQSDFLSGAWIDATTEEVDGVTVLLIRVNNTSGTALPMTGGPGVEMFEAIGGIMMALAFVALVIRKRRMA